MLSTTVYRVSHSKVDKVDWLWWGCMFEVFLVCPMCSWEVLYFAYFTSLKKYIYIGWPQQPLTQKVSDISEKLDFWWSIPQKGTGIGQLGAREDQTVRISNFLMKWGCRGHWGCRSFKAWKITTEDFRVIQALEFSFIFMFWKKVFLGRIMKYHIEF